MYPSITTPAVNIPTVTGKIYEIIENLTDIIEELNKDPSSADGPSPINGPSPAQICTLKGIAGLDGDGGGGGGIDSSSASACKGGDIDDSGAGCSKTDIGCTGGGRGGRGGICSGSSGEGGGGTSSGRGRGCGSSGEGSGGRGDTEGICSGSGGEGRGGTSSGAGSGIGVERGGGEESAAGGEEKRGLIDSPGKGAEITESPESKDFDLFRYLSGNEGLELIRLESTRQALLRAQGFLEEKKQVFIKLARNRQVGK